jgi:O-antigen/teichoic acid export membrane protein
VGIYSLSGSAAKFLLAIAFGSAGGAIGALWGVVMGTIFGLIVLRLSAGIRLPKISSVTGRLSSVQTVFIKQHLPYIGLCVFVVGGLGFMQNIDIVIAKALFDKQTAGVYSGISILSNAIYYVAFLLVWIVLPEIETDNPDANRRVLGTAYKILGALAVAGLSIEVLTKNFLAQKLLGASFGSQGQLLIYATLFQLSLVSITLYAYYSLIMRRYRILLLAVLIIGLCLLLPWFFGSTPQQMIKSLLVAVLSGSAIYGIINSSFRRRKK